MSCREDSIRLRRKHQVCQCASQADAVEVGAEVPRWSDSGRLWIVVRAGNGGEDGAGVGAAAAARESQKHAHARMSGVESAVQRWCPAYIRHVALIRFCSTALMS